MRYPTTPRAIHSTVLTGSSSRDYPRSRITRPGWIGLPIGWWSVTECLRPLLVGLNGLIINALYCAASGPVKHTYVISGPVYSAVFAASLGHDHAFVDLGSAQEQMTPT
jgi:hypothetical protein